MAFTWTKAHIKVNRPDDALLDVVSMQAPEGASQTFASSAPVIFSSGLVIESTSPINTTNKLSGFSLEASHNTSGATVKWIPAYPGIRLFATLLAASAADYVLAAADLWSLWLLTNTANFPTTAADGWYLEHTATNAGVRLTSFGPTDQVPPNVQIFAAATGDTNARVVAEATSTVLTFL